MQRVLVGALKGDLVMTKNIDQLEKTTNQLEKTTEQLKKPTCSHDNFFKLIFSDPKLVKELLKLLFTKAEQEVFNLDDIKFEKDTHKKQLADIVLSFPLKNYPKQRTEFFMILEHKSYNDKDSYEQMLKYIFLIREHIVKQTGRAKPIIPALFSHGKKALKLKKSLQEEDFKDFLSKIPIETRQSMLNFKLKVIDTKEPKIGKIVESKGSKIWGVIKLLDEIWDIKEPSAEKVKSIVKDYFGEILKGKTKREVEEIIVGLTEYLRDTTGLKLEEWEKAERELKQEGILKIGGTMDALEVIKEKGRWEGRQEGRQEGIQEGRQEERQQFILNMLKKNADISFISEVTGLSEKEIKKFKNGKT